MKYLLLICAESTVSDEHGILERDPAVCTEGTNRPTANANANANARSESARDWHHGRGILVTGSPAQPSVEANLEFRGDGVLVTDGPFAHVKGRIQSS